MTDIPSTTALRTVTIREYWPNFNMLKLGFADGTELVCCDFYPEGTERTLQVPEGLTLAGFYGTNDIGYFIRSLGFILMEAPEVVTMPPVQETYTAP